MSKIQAELIKATDTEPKRGEDRQEFLQRLSKAINGLSDKAWDGLSNEAQDWFNASAKARKAAKEAGKDAPPFADFPDAEPPQAEERSSRRRDDDEPRRDERPSVDKLKEGDRVKITNKRGKVFEGVITENNTKKEFVAVKGADGEDEIDYDRIESLEVFHGTAKSNDEPADPIRVGAEVTLVTKRGKTYTGTIKELTKDDIVIVTADGDEDFARDRVESITPAKASTGSSRTRAEETSTRGGRSEDKEPETKRSRAGAGPDGKSIGTVIKELIADDFNATEEDIAKQLKKLGVEFKENTLSLNYKDAHKFLEILKDKGKLR